MQYVCSAHGDNDVTTNGTVLGAGVLPITVDPTGELCFLLGREHYVAGWQGSERWSAFEGGTKPGDEDVFHTAAREYIEESLAVLHDDQCTRETMRKVATALRAGEHLFRLTMRVASPPHKHRHNRKPRYHVTFVKYFPYDADLVTRFGEHRQQLVEFNTNAMHWSPPGSSSILHDHVAIHSTGSVAKVSGDFLEKVTVRLWRVSEISECIHNADSAELFRPCFTRLGRLVLTVLLERLRNLPQGASGER